MLRTLLLPIPVCALRVGLIQALGPMNDFRCAFCNTSMRITTWNLVPSRFPETHVCGCCGTANMLSRKTLLFSYAPSLLFMLGAGFAWRAWSFDSGLLLVMPIAYVAGLSVGVPLARRYGRLVPPLRPLL